MKKTILGTAVAAVLGVASVGANAAVVNSVGVFDMYSQLGLDQNPGNQTLVGSINTDNGLVGWVDQDTATWGVSSPNLFNFLPWTASGGQLYTTAGDYALDTASGTVTLAAPDTLGTDDASMHFTIGAGQVAGTIDFAWGSSSGIRVVDVWNVNPDGSLTAAAVPGMENGPFPGFNAAFDLTSPGLVSAVPVPAAAWLFGSAMLGMFGVSRRKKTVA